MGLLSRKSRTDDVSDPAKLLITEHEKVERLFAELKETESANRRQGLVAQLDAELSSHTAAEEELVYPVLRAELENGDELMDRAEQEHAEAKQALAGLVATDAADPDFPKAVQKLEKLVKAHVKEEEKRIFPEMEKAIEGGRLADVRAQLEETKFATTPRPLEPELPARRAAKKTAGRKTAAKKRTAKKSAAKRTAAKKSAAARTLATKKASTKRSPAKKSAAARTLATKRTATKKSTAKKAAAKKTAAKRSAAKKSARRR